MDDQSTRTKATGDGLPSSSPKDREALSSIPAAMHCRDGQGALEELARGLGMSMAVIARIEDAGAEFSCVAHYGVQNRTFRKRYRLEGSVVEAVLSREEPLYIPAGAMARYPADPLLSVVGAETLLGVGKPGHRRALLLFGQEPAVIPPCSDSAFKVLALYLHALIDREDLARSLERAQHDLVAREKELACIHGVTEAISNLDEVGDICRRVAELLPAAWTHPEKARARVVLDGAVFETAPFDETKWGHSAAIVAGGRARGMVQVFYTEDLPSVAGGGPFAPGERNLLDTIARTLGEMIERREAEAGMRAQSARLTAERNRLEAVLRSIGDGVVVTTGKDDLVLLMNTAAQELLGPFDTEPTGVPFLKLIEDADFRAVWKATAAQGQDFSKQELRTSLPQPRSLSATRTQVPNLHEGHAGHVTILHDVTAEREIDQMKTDFASAVSHELRTPLTSIKGFAVTLRGKPNMEPELRERFLEIIDQEADRLVTLIEDLLVMARIESGRVIVEHAPVDVAPIIREAVESFAPEMVRKGISHAMDIDSSLAHVSGDREKIRIILVNLLQNAVKFTPNGGTVTVTARHDANEVRIDVQDTGVGIPEHEQQRIFDRFYRVKRKGMQEAGTGLGLFIAKEMVRLHGGHIEVSSRVGKGSVFSVYLPLHHQRASRTAAPVQ